jgi:inosine-uridine nucleoside N-ribohydrolase
MRQPMNRFPNSLITVLIIFALLLGCTPPTEEASEETEPAGSSTEELIPPTDVPEPTEEEIAQQVDDEGFPDASAEVIPVIFSHGGAPCDIDATVYLTQHPNVDLIGMVLSRGEVQPEAALENWGVFLYDILNSHQTALALGSDEKMDPNWHDFPAGWRPPANNFWDLSLPNPVTEFEIASGPELIVELVNGSPKKVTLVAMASMIDVVLALQMDPGIIDNIAHVVVMGGAFTVEGNLDDDPSITDNTVAEWNMWIDAEAAQYLMSSGVRVSIVPLDATLYLVQPEDVDRMYTIDDPGVNYVAQVWNLQRGWWGEFLIWDTIAIMAVTHPELFDWTYDGVEVITEPGPTQGQTIPLNNGATHIRYATDADYGAIMEQIFQIMRGEIPTVGSGTPWVTVEGTTIIGLGGRWEGFTDAFTIIFTLDPNCELGIVCGTFEIPDFTLTGDITFVDIDGDTLRFEATNFSSGTPNEDLVEYLQVLDDGTVRYVSIGPEVTNEAILIQQ